MDIIGNGAPADRPHGRDVPRERDAEAHLDLDAEPDPEAAPARGRLLPDLLSAESLAVGALVLGAGTLSGGSWMQFLLFGNYDGTASGPQEQYLRAAVLYGIPAALALVLGLGALARRRPDGPPWVRGLAGGAVLTAVVLLVVVLVFLQRAAVAPAAEGSFG